jgi:hypothetical protein
MIGSESCEEVLYQRGIFQIRRQMGPTLIKLRIDVDYPYPSRIRSFIYTIPGIEAGRILCGG